jgi:hypothetical protein
VGLAAAPVPKPYLYAEELAVLTPWSVEEISAKVKRGILRRGVHYFQERHRTRRIFKWEAIVRLIESRSSDTSEHVDVFRGSEKVIDVEKATTGLYRLLDR